MRHHSPRRRSLLKITRVRQSYWPYLRRSWRELSLLGVAATVMVILTAFSFYLTSRVERDRDEAVRLAQFNAELVDFVRVLRNLESCQRGYVLTSNPDFLKPYHRFAGSMDANFARLQAMAPADPQTRALLEEIRPLLRDKLDEMNGSIRLMDNAQRDDAVRQISEGFGRRVMEQILERVEVIQAQGKTRQYDQTYATTRLEQAKIYVDIVGALVVIGFSAGAMLLLMRSNGRLQRAQEALAQANDELEDTVLERTAALKRANEEVQRFAYIVSHDLRSPLVNIMGFTAELEALRDELFEKLAAADALKDAEHLGHEFDEAFSFIKNSIARMDRLIGAILKISREGARVLNPEPINMNAMVDGLVKGLAHQIKERNVEIVVEDLPNVFSDRLALEQIFSNLIDNAIKFLNEDEPGRIVITGEERGFQARYRISDNGRGIDEKDHARIFELFRRAGSQTTQGEGIGLAYVMTLLRRLHGTIDVESKVGEGATFIIVMPRTLAVAERKAA